MPGKKDPNKPKGAKNAYQFFLDALRDENKANNIQLSFADFSKEASDKWKALEDDDKETYNKQAEKDKKRYQKEMANYTPPSDSDSDEDQPKKKKKKVKDPNAPKKPQSAYFQFANVHRAKTKAELEKEGGDSKVTDVASKLGEKWRGMSDKEKEPYEEMAAKDKERYQKDLERYNADK